jgi:hypothetical protein
MSVLVCAPWLRLRLRGVESAAARRGRVAHPGVAPTAYRRVVLLATLGALLFAAWLSVDLGGPVLSAIVDHGATALVDNARVNGWSWQDIASRLGVTKQAVHQKHGPRSRSRPGR